jgi:hypothetical protein
MQAPSLSGNTPVTNTAITAIPTPQPWWYPKYVPGSGYTPGFGGGGMDTIPPVISGTPSNSTAEATSASGAAVTYTAPIATDVVDGTDTVSCAPSSGSTFAIGTTTVTCSATDRADNTSHTSFTVTVRDTTPPSINNTPSNVTTNATGSNGATVTYTSPTAIDLVDGSIPVSCSPVSGSTFALGTATVTCSATDAHGNSSHTSFTVTIQDTTPPTITGTPSNMTAQATSGSGAAVTYTSPTASDIVDGTDPVSCSPASGSTFALGTATVTCSATDAHGNTAHTSFTVTVQDTSAPSVSITAPSNGATVAGSSVTLTAAATDSIVAVANVRFKVDGTNIGSVITSSPYTTTWNSKSVSDGSHTLYAVAESASGNYATSSVNISVRNGPPVISSISSGTPSPYSATITWTTDEPATSQVNYGTTTSYGTASSSAALVTSHAITLTGLTASTAYNFQVESVDAEGNTATSSNQTLTTAADTLAASLTAPSSGAAVSGSSVTLSATTSGNVAVTGVQFKVDGTNIGSAITSSPYTTTWNSTGVADGSHALYAVAEDTLGNYATSSIGVTVENTAVSISSIATTSVASSTETIAWTTNEPATSQVNFGTTTSYGTASSSAALVTSHAITLTGLTASTTYDYAVVSTNAVGNTATSSNQTFTTAAYNYYVDSVNGNDANPGTSPALAFQNITALPTIAAGQSVGLADGSDWRQQLTVSGSNVTITAYGTGTRPILDASNVIPNASFTKTAGYTNVYNAATTTFACLATYGAGCSGSWINVWETGAAGDNANGQTLKYETSIASVDSTACSYYLYGGQTTGGGAPTSATIYVHSCDGTSPITNGYTYEYANRRAAIYSNGNSNVVVSGVEGRKAVANTGPFDFENDDGGSITLNNVLARDCNDHCAVLPGGSTVENSTFLDGYWGGSNATFVVFYEGTSSGKPFTLSNNNFQSDQTNLGANAGVISHSGNLANLGTVTSSNNWFISKNGATLMGYQLQYVPQLNISGDYASQLYQYLTTLASTSVSNTQYVSAVSSNTYMQIGANGGSLTLSGDSTCTENDAHIVSVGGSYTGTSITDSGSTYYKGSPNASTLDVFLGPSTALTINNDTFDGAINPIFPYNFSGSGSTFTGGTTTGTANSYNATDHVTRFVWNGTTYTSLSQWLAAISPQDSAAVTTRSGVGACTLPTIPTVN